MFFAPKEIKKEIPNKSLIYTPKRVLVSKEFTFDAAHHLFQYEGKCKSLHGHTYRLQIAVSGMLDERGMVYDFGDLKAIYKEHLEPQLDHRYLNESLPYMNTTAENMVYWIYKTVETHLPDQRGLQIESVRLYETPSSYAEFRKEWDLA
ncbi:6-carboxytetrahydropterin synthase QueD [Streptococcus tangpeifui]|uniref:6-carboxytetrahydropterin synthase QueD n=1 Tax=Streptococcus tangpeifui TaxID=2709400 RepID=UPI0013EB3429|nr:MULTISPECIES: 6-carboxytetrahydropterin synthase QueD [unclassified Streptococcus]